MENKETFTAEIRGIYLKIAVNLFEISKIGGIWTFQRNLVDGLKKLGCHVEEFFLTLSKKPVRELNRKEGIDEGITKLKPLGFRTEKALKDYYEQMEQFDAVIFTHPCPHINKAYSDISWKKCYELDIPKIAVFHEGLAETHYPWIRQAKIDFAVAVQKKATLSLDFLSPEVKKAVIYHPLNLDDMLYDYSIKREELIAPHQFKSWKRMHVVIKAIPSLKYVVHVTGKGTEYHYMRRVSYPFEDFGKKPSKATIQLRQILSGKWKGKTKPVIYEKYLEYGTIWKDAEGSGKLAYHGILPKRELINLFRISMAVIDVSYGELGTNSKRNTLISLA